jgi:hypothetical protein
MQASLKVQRGIYDLDGTELPPLPAAEEEAKAVVSMVGGVTCSPKTTPI